MIRSGLVRVKLRFKMRESKVRMRETEIRKKRELKGNAETTWRILSRKRK